VRAAAVYALGRFLGKIEVDDERVIVLDVVGLRLAPLAEDGRFVYRYKLKFAKQGFFFAATT